MKKLFHLFRHTCVNIVCLAITSALPLNAQTTFTWNSSVTSTAWLTANNWTGGSAGKVPGDGAATLTTDNNAGDIAIIGNVGFSGSTIGLNMNTAGGSYQVGAIMLNTTTRAITFGKSDTTVLASTLRLNGGTVNVGATGGSLGNTVLAVGDSGTQNFTVANTAGGSGTMDVQLGISSGNIYVTTARTLTINSKITELNSGSGFVKLGGGALVLGGANTFTGKITNGAGSISISSDTNLGAVPASPVADQLTLDFSILRFTGTFTLETNRGVTLAAAGGTFEIGDSKTVTYAGNITGLGGLTKSISSGASSGNLTLSGVNDFAGNFSITGGGVRFNSDTAAGKGTVVVTASGGSVTLRNLGIAASTLTNAVIFNSSANTINLDSDPGSTFTMSGNISGDGAVINGGNSTGGGTIILSGNNSAWSGSLSLRRGGLSLGNKNALAAQFIVSPIASSNVTLQATTDLSGVNALTNAVSLAMTNSNVGFAIGGANNIEFAGAITMVTNAVITNNNSASTILSGAIGGSFGISFAGTGTTTLKGANTYTGGTTNLAGTLKLGASGVIPDTSAVTVAGGTFDLDGNSETIASLAGGGSVVLGSGALTAGGDNSSTTFSGAISGSGSFTKTGTGTLTLSGASLLSGQTTVSAGKLSVENTTGSGTGSGQVTVASSAKLGGTGFLAGAVTVAGTIAPGVSAVGPLATGSQVWNGLAAYEWQLNSATGAAGTAYDTLNISGSLDLSGLTSGSKFTLKLATLNGTSAGSAANFDLNTSYTWTIATASGGITGFDTNNFAIDSSGFVNTTVFGSYFTLDLANSGTQLVLKYVVPEVQDPAIVLQPTSKTTNAQAMVTFSVSVSGTSPFTYQWRKDGVNLTDVGTITGSQSSTLTISSVSYTNNGSYDVIVTNANNASVTSQPATLTVNDPVIVTSPTSITNNYGSQATFSATVVGTAPLSYQWRRNGSNLTDGSGITGSQTDTLSIDSVSYLNAGTYDLIVTNGNSSATSAAATLTVNDPRITSSPTSVTNCSGTTLAFTVTATGTEPLFYQWKRGGANIVGATTSVLTLNSITQADATNGSYTAIVTNASTQVATSSAATLTVLESPTITSAPASRTVQAGVNVTFTVAATGGTGYQWSVNGSPITGATTTSLVRNSVSVGSETISVSIASASCSPSVANAVLTVVPGSLRLYDTNLVVVRAGEGTQTLTVNGNSIYLDQFTTTGGYVNTVTIPDTGATRLVQSSGATEGALNRSADGRLLTLAGYDAAPAGASSVSGATSVSVPRVGATINALASYSRVLKITNTYSQSGFRSVTTDGTNKFWCSGGNSGTIHFDSINNSTVIQNGKANTRVAQIYNGDLWISSASATVTPAVQGLFKFNGTPTSTQSLIQVATGAQTGNGDGIQDFAVSPTGTTVYYTDDRGGTNQPIQRWDLVGGTWAFSYYLGTGLGTLGSRFMTVDWSGPYIYATTTESTQNKLVKIVDTGSGSAATVIATAGPGQLFRGVKFGPVAAPPTIATAPVNSTNAIGSSALFTVTAAGTAPFSYQWQKDGNDISGATTTSYNIASVTSGDVGSYTVVVTNEFGSAQASAMLFTLPQITQDPTGQTLTYGSGSVGLSVNANGIGTLSYQWQKNGGNLSGETLSTYSISSPVVGDSGSYTVRVSNDYGAVTSAVAVVTINKATPSVAWTPASPITYGTALGGGVLNASSPVSGSFSYNPVSGTVLGAGGYTLSAVFTPTDTDNFTTNSITAGLTVTKAVLTVAAGSKSKVYGDANPTLTVSYSGFVNGDDETVISGSPSLNTTADTLTGVGGYTITAGAEALSAANYSFSTVNGTLLITPAPISVVANDNTKVQGTANPALTGTITGIRNSDVITANYSTTATESSPAGDYAITPQLVGAALTNYTASITNGTLHIVAGVAFTSVPTSVTNLQGELVTFAINATGVGTLNYQWVFAPTNGNPSTVVSTSNSVVIASVSTNDAGTYTVTVTDDVSTNSASATLSVIGDSIKPVLKVLSPLANFGYRTNAGLPSLLIKGTSFDVTRVASVQYDFNNAGYTNADMAYVGKLKPTNWSSTITLVPGTNTLKVRTFDLAGNGVTNSLTFYYHTVSPLTIVINGTGSVGNATSPSMFVGNNTNLFVGRTYSLSTFIGAGTNQIGYVLTNVTYTAAGGQSGELFVNSNALPKNLIKFMMRSNMVITFNFLDNPLLRHGGTYNGLFFNTNNVVDHDSAGYLNLIVTPKWTYSGKMYLHGNIVPVKGKLSINGTGATTSSRAKLGYSDVSLNFAVDFATESDTLTGSIASAVDGWASHLDADRFVWTTNVNETAAAWTNSYTLAIPGYEDKTAGPPGYGYVSTKVDLKGGIVPISGYLADGTVMKFLVTKVSKNGDWPFYASLQLTNRTVTYNSLPLPVKEGTTTVIGWLRFDTNAPGSLAATNLAPQGDLTWIKTGFTNLYTSLTNPAVAVTGSRLWIPPTAGTPFINQTNLIMTFSEGDLVAPLVATNYTLTGLNTVKPPLAAQKTANAAITIAAKIGTITGSFTRPSTTTVVKHFGVVLQDYKYGRGFFVGTTEGGVTTLSFNP